MGVPPLRAVILQGVMRPTEDKYLVGAYTYAFLHVGSVHVFYSVQGHCDKNRNSAIVSGSGAWAAIRFGLTGVGRWGHSVFVYAWKRTRAERHGIWHERGKWTWMAWKMT